jgi:DNA-binding response OmpR family regulator
MPGVDGFELVKRARQTRPKLRVLFMSGYAAEYHIDPDRDDFVAKPFDPRQLLGCIYEILARKGGEGRA